MKHYALATLISICALAFTARTACADIASGSCSTAQQSLVTNTHATTIRGQAIAYTATTGFMEVTSADGSAKACIFYIAYTVPQTGATPRPITFAFNGGPGSASLWLHLGFLGPKRVDLGPDGLSGSGELITNDSSPLDVSDIVMIDPVATGFSFSEGTGADDKFFGVLNDYKSVAAFVQSYLNNFNRWDSPKFVVGESYGGVRGSLLANHLQSDLGIGLSGLFLVSPELSDLVFDFQSPDNQLSYVTFFPNFATTAWYHKKMAPQYAVLTLDKAYAAAKEFADGRLRQALDAGDDIDPTEFDQVAQMMSDFTGLPKSVIVQNNLRISDTFFFTGLMADQHIGVGRYDSRFTNQILPGATDNNYVDPSDTGTGYPYTSGINEYLRGDLAFPLTSPYATQGNITDWPVSQDGSGTINVVDDLAQALAYNPKMKVEIASGYFDLACPMATVDYELSQLPGGSALRGRIQHIQYFGGHMMYINPTALTQLHDNFASFVTGK